MTTDNFCFDSQSKPVKQEDNGTVILPPVVIPGICSAPNIIITLGSMQSSAESACKFTRSQCCMMDALLFMKQPKLLVLGLC
jgi:hypothetical protein